MDSLLLILLISTLSLATSQFVCFKACICRGDAIDCREASFFPKLDVAETGYRTLSFGQNQQIQKIDPDNLGRMLPNLRTLDLRASTIPCSEASAIASKMPSIEVCCKKHTYIYIYIYIFFQKSVWFFSLTPPTPRGKGITFFCHAN